MKNALFIASQYLTPQHLLSRVIGKLASCNKPWLKDNLIKLFIDRYQVDMSIAENPDPKSYSCFNDFFTRPLAQGQRPIAEGEQTIACPADGAVSQIGKIELGRVMQAKGQDYSLLELIGGDSDLAAQFQEGNFATIYLSPKDYHRVHMPFTGTLKTMIHVPGDLFSVNDTTAANVPRLFARNERVVCIFETTVGPMAVILVGAMIVASIETVWAGQVTPVNKQIRQWNYNNQEPITLNKGDELGRFKLGSTAIVLFGKDTANWSETLAAKDPVLMGQAMGEANH